MYVTKKNIKRFFSMLVILSAGLVISACSGGSSGGSASGAGSSSVEGNVSSVNVAMLQSTDTGNYSFAGFLKTLVSAKPAHAATTVEGINVELAGMQTTTNSGGYFRFDGVPPGTHDVRFSGNGYASSMPVDVGENDMVTMQDVSMNGHQARARSVSHRMPDNYNDMDRDMDRDVDRDMDRNMDRNMDRGDYR